MTAGSTSPFAVLSCDPSTIPASQPDRQLIVDYSPIVVIFPEVEAVGPPWRMGLADYFPRSIRMFLDDARLVPPRLIRSESALVIWMALHAESWVRRIQALFSGQIKRLDAKRGLGERIQHRRDGLRDYVLDAGVSESRDAWRRYHRLLTNDYPPTSYVRVMRRDGQLVIQYWFFYYFNDFWNRHQADFELVSVHFRKGNGGYVPTGCVYGAHRGGCFRLWDDAERRTLRADSDATVPTHPVAYVARGSHAFYPRPKLEGWVPSLGVTAPFPLANVHMEIVPVDGQAEVLDFVPLPIEKEFKARLDSDDTVKYTALVMPTDIEKDIIPRAKKIWDDWWWIRFEGGWGPANFTPYFFLAQPSVRGPAYQDRFQRPWEWLAKKCHPDQVGEWTLL